MQIIAECGCNHKGDLEIAKEMINVLVYYCKIKHIKFQKRCIKELLTKEEYNKLYDNPNSFGKTYGEHREFLEFDIIQHMELKNECERLGVIYTSSVWDLTSAIEIAELNPKLIKIPSASNLDFNMLEYLRDEYKGEIHISLGMTTKKEIEQIYNFMKSRKEDLILYACTSGYPIKFKDACLMEIDTIKKYKCKAYGYSGHHLGIAIDLGAYCLNYDYLERHFTLDRTWKGTDHAASLEPEGMKKLVRDANAIEQAMNYKYEDILEIEKPQRLKLKRGLND